MPSDRLVISPATNSKGSALASTSPRARASRKAATPELLEGGLCKSTLKSNPLGCRGSSTTKVGVSTHAESSLSASAACDLSIDSMRPSVTEVGTALAAAQ